MRLPFSSLVAAALLAACSANSSSAPDPAPVALVKTSAARNGGVASTRSIYGAVLQSPDSQYILAAPVEAIVSRIAAPVGTSVGRGSLIVALSPSPSTRAEIARLAADARSAQQAYERAKRLRADGLVSDAEVESARAAAQGASASRAAISSQTSGLALRAPGAGYVQSIATSPGNLVSAGAPIATISKSGNLRARLGIAPSLVDRISRGGGIVLTSDDSDPAVTVPILTIDPTVDPQTKLASIYISVPAGLGLAPGQPVRGKVTLEQSVDEVVIPYAALLDDGGQPYVFVIDGGVARRKDVMIGASDGDMVAITKGVQIGQKVVVSGGTALEDGMKVRTK